MLVIFYWSFRTDGPFLLISLTLTWQIDFFNENPILRMRRTSIDYSAFHSMIMDNGNIVSILRGSHKINLKISWKLFILNHEIRQHVADVWTSPACFSHTYGEFARLAYFRLHYSKLHHKLVALIELPIEYFVWFDWILCSSWNQRHWLVNEFECNRHVRLILLWFIKLIRRISWL